MASRIPYDELHRQLNLIIDETTELTAALTQLRDYDFGRDIDPSFVTDAGFLRIGGIKPPINPPARPCEPIPMRGDPGADIQPLGYLDGDPDLSAPKIADPLEGFTGPSLA